MENSSVLETKEQLESGQSLNRKFWQQRAKDDAGKIESGETNLREVLTQWAELVAQKERKEKVDDLTGVFNKKTFEEAMPRVIDFCRKTETSLGLLWFDIDNFKKLNDSHGHEFGDQVLKRLGATLLQTVRHSDHPARVGGEEFAALLPGAETDDLEMIAERLRLAVENLSFEDKQPQVKVTISVGATHLNSKDTPGTFKNRADQAMYQAKKAGKNQVCILLGV